MKRQTPFEETLAKMGVTKEHRKLTDAMVAEGVSKDHAEWVAIVKIMERRHGMNLGSKQMLRPRKSKVPMPTLDMSKDHGLRTYILEGFLACHANAERPTAFDKRTGAHMRWITGFLLGTETSRTAPTEGLRLFAGLLKECEDMRSAVSALLLALEFTDKPVHWLEGISHANSRRTKKKAS